MTPPQEISNRARQSRSGQPLSAPCHATGRELSREIGRTLDLKRFRRLLDIGGGTGAFFALNMLVGIQGGDTYTFAEIRDGLENAGFSDVRLLSPGGERRNGLVQAIKPEVYRE